MSIMATAMGGVILIMWVVWSFVTIATYDSRTDLHLAWVLPGVLAGGVVGIYCVVTFIRAVLAG